MSESKLKVMEVYEACQGEGSNIGRKVVFVRLFGCNFRCSWCDTAYSINMREWKDSGEKGEPYQLMTAEEVTGLVLQRSRYAVITGGEPTVHQGKLTQLLKVLTNAGVRSTVETNASIVPDGVMGALVDQTFYERILWSLSPKMKSAGKRVWVDEPIIDWYMTRTRCQLKFVIGKPTDLFQIRALLERIEERHSERGLDPDTFNHPIVLQPEGSIIENGVNAYLKHLAALQEVGAGFWTRYDLRVLPQLHTLMHGQKRYV